MPSTGDTKQIAGIYRHTCGERITMPKGHTFPPCSKCNKGGTWTLVDRT